jgi:hypothetical protein
MTCWKGMQIPSILRRIWQKPWGLGLALWLLTILVGVGYWWLYSILKAPRHGVLFGSPPAAAVVIIIVALFGAISVLYLVRIRAHWSGLSALLAHVISSAVWSFSTLYFQLSGNQPWAFSARPLSHIDAFYFTLGTLTTAGSSISPISQAAKMAVSGQLVIDLLLMGVVLGVVASRVSGHTQGDSNS